MKCGVRVALGITGGYLLGRTKKMKLALMLGGMAAGRRAGGPGQLLEQGMKLLGQSPELTRLTDEIRGRLLEAGKGAAVAVATRQVEALTDRLVGRVGAVTDAGGQTVSDAGEAVGDIGRTVSGLGRRRSRDETEYDEEPAQDQVHEEEAPEVDEEEAPEVEEEAPEVEEEAPEVEEEEAPPPPRRRPARPGAVGSGGADTPAGRVGGAPRSARDPAARRAGRPARGRQGRSDG